MERVKDKKNELSKRLYASIYMRSSHLSPPILPPSLPPNQTAFEMRLFKKTRHNNARSECTYSVAIRFQETGGGEVGLETQDGGKRSVTGLVACVDFSI